ncbi:MAG: hypothetical protein QM750_20605 [Rubrivivax sp.]
MKKRRLIFGERSLTLIGASFGSFSAADRARRLLEHEPSLGGEVSLIAPDDPLAAVKLEPEHAGIWRTLIKSHVVLGAAGAVAGALAAGLATDLWAGATLSPGYTLLFMTVLGAYAGMLLAGLLTLRPDHGYVIRRLRDSLARRNWAVVVHPSSRPRARLALRRLRGLGVEPVSSF